jgi:hypothetical protein
VTLSEEPPPELEGDAEAPHGAQSPILLQLPLPVARALQVEDSHIAVHLTEPRSSVKTQDQTGGKKWKRSRGSNRRAQPEWYFAGVDVAHIRLAGVFKFDVCAS